MHDEKSPPIPLDHAIHEIWALNRLDLAGMIALAESGDKDANKYLMKLSAYHVDIDHESPKLLKKYIARKLQEACKSGDANKAFGFTQDKTKRPGTAKLTYLEKRQQCSIGYRVAQFIDEMPSNNKAYDLAAEEFGIKRSNARYCYEEYMKV